MTRQQLFDQINLELGQDSQDNRFHENTIFMAASTVISELLPDYLHTYGESAIELFCVPVILTVQKDTVRNRNYVQLGFQVLGMKDRSGLVQVCLAQDEEVVFIPVQLGMNAVYAGLEAGGAAGNLLYWLEGQRIYFKTLPAGVTDILVKAVPNLYDLLNDDDQVPMPAEFAAMVITGTKERLAPQKQGDFPSQDKTEDNRSEA